jgi:sortase A
MQRHPPSNDRRSGDERRGRRRSRYRAAEIACWILAAVLIAPQLVVVAARAGMTSGPDESWSPARRAEFERLSRGLVPAPQGHLVLPDQALRVPVFDGIEEIKLTLGAGRMTETAPLGGDGNTAIAGHRDGFFRSLRHLQVGDSLVLETGDGSRRYRITDQWVVAPEDVWVLNDTQEPSLTLITCHPFYHVGSAPDRFIVRAVLVQESSEATGGMP